MVVACGALQDEAKRGECFRAAAAEAAAEETTAGEAGATEQNEAIDEALEGAGTNADFNDAGPPSGVAPNPVPESASEDDGTTAAAVETVEEIVEETIGESATVSPAVAPSTPIRSTTASSPPVTPAPVTPATPEVDTAIVTKSVQRDVLVIPDRFSATVTGHRKLVRDRQLVVLDGKLLFEGDRAASSRIKEGDTVEVTKISSLRGRTYQITRPKKRPFRALRIRCELAELSSDNRRKCAAMLR